MPTYEYKCLSCNRTFEHFQKMTDEPLTECKECGGTLKKLIGTGLAPIFKGSGFYQTDYKKSNVAPTSTTNSKSSETSSTSDSKPKNDTNSKVA
ncbi:MAG: zinc ribbon domain-containing protein [Melioribacteraceae bacterium]|nr:zinc ribbon domain-containing protein [Melioribacteraceae bacterium]MCF8354946.1 zinc ribbon domain-containing protein [Melioribacteraceae bacterium]MCF8392365.1 zinc ribbon domain-containing protein [Melioribacteraceae bacterium]MCF8417885.1 zinc ribbon domain-containing protein [Melioribacteraceae bacterium]